MLSIRLARLADRKGIDRITKEFSDHEYSHSSDYFDAALSAKRIFVAEENGKVVAYLTYYIIWGNTPYIELLRVTSTHQRKGIGGKLLSVLEKELKKRGHKVLLSSSEKVNKIGNIFHRRVGFKPIGELNMIYGREIFYKKKLG